MSQVGKPRDWKSICDTWAKAPSQTEQDRSDRAVAAIKKAIAADTTLTKLGVDVFPQGSYANRTNVRQDSDVDVCIRCRRPFLVSYPPGVTDETINVSNSPITFPMYKDAVGKALVSYFGPPPYVVRGNKAFDIHENTYRVDFDAVACFEYREYYFNFLGTLSYHEGCALIPDKGSRATNFPDQQYKNGVAKNDATSKRFKTLVRVIKSLRYDMEDQGVSAATKMASFTIECLVWNWPDANFDAPSWHEMALRFLAFLYEGTKQESGCSSWKEENNIKLVFGPHSSVTRSDVNAFAAAAFRYIGGK